MQRGHTDMPRCCGRGVCVLFAVPLKQASCGASAVGCGCCLPCQFCARHCCSSSVPDVCPQHLHWLPSVSCCATARSLPVITPRRDTHTRRFTISGQLSCSVLCQQPPEEERMLNSGKHVWHLPQSAYGGISSLLHASAGPRRSAHFCYVSVTLLRTDVSGAVRRSRQCSCCMCGCCWRENGRASRPSAALNAFQCCWGCCS
ncbi:hypothetical protein COO60DRAFT_239105 [Scenedesmus sp. NREL 46B-D3]|nr:hypothetical protein COO60DRAFT_239105 [Scenedesmus sp. NREL 46B-D3]